jgi:hypothetical protein
VAYYINGNIDLTSLIAQPWSPCNVIVLGFVYTVDIASKVQAYDFQFYPNAAALPPYAQFVTNAYGLSAGGSAPLPYPMNPTLVAQLQTWQAVEPSRRKIMFGIGGASLPPNYWLWSQGNNVTTVAAGVAAFLTNVQALYPGLKFAGVDFDYEDTTALSYYGPPTATQYVGTTLMINLTKAVRAVLPNIMLTHAPQSPYLANGSVSGLSPALKPGGSAYASYLYILSQVAPLLSGLFIQFYNQNAAVQGAGPDFAILDALVAGQTVTSNAPGVPASFTVPPMPRTGLFLGQCSSCNPPAGEAQWVQPAPSTGTSLMFWIQATSPDMGEACSQVTLWYPGPAGTLPCPASAATRGQHRLGTTYQPHTTKPPSQRPVSRLAAGAVGPFTGFTLPVCSSTDVATTPTGIGLIVAVAVLGAAVIGLGVALGVNVATRKRNQNM